MKRRIAFGLFTVLLSAALPLHAEETRGVGADEALAKLVEGNKRFVEMKLAHPDQDAG